MLHRPFAPVASLSIVAIAGVTTVVVACVAPRAHAQEVAPAPPLTTAAAQRRFDAIADDLGRADALHALADLATDAVVGVTHPEHGAALRDWCATTLWPGVRAPFVRRAGLGHGSAQFAVARLGLALPIPAITDDVITAFGHDMGRTRELLPLAASIAALPLSAGQDDAFFEHCRTLARRDPRTLDRLIPAIEQRAGERWLRLLTETGLSGARAIGVDGPVVLRHIADALGRWWTDTPHLRLRVPALCTLATVPDADLQTAALAALARCTFQPVTNPARLAKTWKAFARRHAGATDGELILALLAEHRAAADGEAARFAADLAPRLAELGRRDARWATPVLLAVFGWNGDPLAQARTAAIVALRRIGDPAAVPALVALVAAQASDDRTQADAIMAIGALAGDPAGSVEEILRRSLRVGSPLPRRAAAMALGQLRVANAVDELLRYGDQATDRDAAAAWRALARIGNGPAFDGLLARCALDHVDRVDVDVDEIGPVVRAFGQSGTWPVPERVATRLAALWDMAFDGGALTVAQREGLREALVAVVFGGPPEGDAGWRALAHPTLESRLRRLCLSTDPGRSAHAHDALARWLTTAEPAAAWEVARSVLAAPPDTARAERALEWLQGHHDPAWRDDLVQLLGRDPQPQATRLALLQLIARADTWNDDACYPAVLALLRRAAGTDDVLLRAAADVADSHPSVANAPAIIALLPERAGEDDLLGMRIGRILYGWGVRARLTGGHRWPQNLPNLRHVWRRWWSQRGAGVTFDR